MQMRHSTAPLAIAVALLAGCASMASTDCRRHRHPQFPVFRALNGPTPTSKLWLTRPLLRRRLRYLA